MKKELFYRLSRRERQLLEVVYRSDGQSVAQIREKLPDPSSYSSIRALMQILEDKGFVRHEKNGKRYVYFPTIAKQRAKNDALQHLLKTFFNNSVSTAVAALLELPDAELDEGDIKEIQKMIKSSRSEKRSGKRTATVRR